MPRLTTAPLLPFSGATPMSRHCSYEAARQAADDRGDKSARYLRWLLRVGCASDHTAAEYFCWPLSSICSIRNGLFERGYIGVFGSQTGRYGKRVTLWYATALARRDAATHQGAA